MPQWGSCGVRKLPLQLLTSKAHHSHYFLGSGTCHPLSRAPLLPLLNQWTDLRTVSLHASVTAPLSYRPWGCHPMLDVLMQRNPEVSTTASAQNVGDGFCLTLLCECILLVKWSLHQNLTARESGKYSFWLPGFTVEDGTLTCWRLKSRPKDNHHVVKKSLIQEWDECGKLDWNAHKPWFIRAKLDSFFTCVLLKVSLYGVYNLLHPRCHDEEVSVLERVGPPVTVRKCPRAGGGLWALSLFHGGSQALSWW